MHIRKQILLVFLAIFAITSTLAAVSIFSYWQQEPILRSFEEDIQSTVEEDVQLLLLAKNMRTDVIQVQQWLSDISATRGLDGLNDGLDEAENNANLFMEDLDKATIIAKAMDDAEVVAMLDQMREAFPPYYETGKKMAKAYMAEGPAGGNPMMGDFDAVAEKISELAEKLLTTVQTQSDENLHALTQNILKIEESNTHHKQIIMGLTAIGMLLMVLASVYIYTIISRNFALLTDDLNDIGEGNFSGDIHLNAASQNEFGHTARSLVKIKEALASAEQVKAEQEEAKKQAEIDKKQAMQDLANRFESKVQGIIKSVAAAATQLYTTSESMSGTIGRTNQRAGSVTHASEQASQNVQAVATATEEMSASVSEIAQQIVRSSSAVQNAVREMNKADETSQTG